MDSDPARNDPGEHGKALCRVQDGRIAVPGGNRAAEAKPLSRRAACVHKPHAPLSGNSGDSLSGHPVRNCSGFPGAFEYKNYHDLNGREDYQTWIDSGGELPFPGGESRAAFAARCVRAFERIRKEAPQEDCALIVHGGTIMALMEAMARPKGNYYDYQVQNGCGYILEEDGSSQAIP